MQSKGAISFVAILIALACIFQLSYTAVSSVYENRAEEYAEAAVAAVLASVEESLVKEDKVQLFGFGTFEVRERAAKEGRNPRTGETLKIAASKVPAFKAGKALKEAVK